MPEKIAEKMPKDLSATQNVKRYAKNEKQNLRRDARKKCRKECRKIYNKKTHRMPQDCRECQTQCHKRCYMKIMEHVAKRALAALVLPMQQRKIYMQCETNETLLPSFYCLDLCVSSFLQAGWKCSMGHANLLTTSCLEPA